MAHLWLSGGLVAAAVARPMARADGEPKPVPGIEAVVSAAKEHPVIAIEDIPGCEQVHEFLRSVISNPGFRRVVRDVVVEFGNPRYQNLVDRCLLEGEPVARAEFRHVWQDTPRSLDLAWDSPVYAEFFEAVRRVNADLPSKERLRVTLGGPSVDWSRIRGPGDLEPFVGAAAERSLAEAISTITASGRHALVISSIPDLRSRLAGNDPRRVWAIRSRATAGDPGRSRVFETSEVSWPWYSVAAIRGTTLGSLPIDGTSGARKLEEVADAVLYLGPTESLTVLRPSADTFQDDAYWNELNRRSELVFHAPFSFAKAGFDLRCVPPRDPASERAASDAPPSRAVDRGQDGVDFVLQSLDEHPLLGLADDHRGLGFCEFLCRLIRDPRVPEAVDDVIVECGNPTFQTTIDRWVVEGEPVARDERKRAWQTAAMGWETANSPVYEHVIDTVREVNLRLAPSKRLHVVLGDAAIDPERVRADPEKYLHDFIAYHETARDPRERGLAASANAVIGKGRRGIMICGGGHLAKGKRPGNAREFIDAEHPGEFGFIEVAFDESTPAGFVTVDGERAILSLGPWRERREVGVPPRVFRDRPYWDDIDRVQQLVLHRAIDLTAQRLLYRAPLVDDAMPAWLQAAADAD